MHIIKVGNSKSRTMLRYLA